MKERTELAPCPFCGGKAHTSFRSGVTGRVCRSKWFRGHIRCTSCNATGPVKTNPQEAISSWNKAKRLTETAHNSDSHSGERDDYYRGAEADYLSHVQQLRSAREWGD